MYAGRIGEHQFHPDLAAGDADVVDQAHLADVNRLAHQQPARLRHLAQPRADLVLARRRRDGHDDAAAGAG
jgi:hypothetical protein